MYSIDVVKKDFIDFGDEDDKNNVSVSNIILDEFLEQTDFNEYITEATGKIKSEYHEELINRVSKHGITSTNSEFIKTCDFRVFSDWKNIDDSNEYTYPFWCGNNNREYNSEIYKINYTNTNWLWIVEYSVRDGNSVLKKNLGITKTLGKTPYTEGINLNKNDDIISGKEYIFLLYAKKEDGTFIKSTIQTLDIF